jgi:hypothetical protein
MQVSWKTQPVVPWVTVAASRPSSAAAGSSSQRRWRAGGDAAIQSPYHDGVRG